MKNLSKMMSAAALMLVTAIPVVKADVVYQFSNPVYSGDPLPGGNNVFATATFKQMGSDLQLWLDVNSNMPNVANASAWYFNINGVTLSSDDFSNAGVVGSVSGWTALTSSGPNSCGNCSADGAGDYDFEIDFAAASAELSANHFAVININSAAALSLSMFDNALSVMPNDSIGFGAAIHVQRIDTTAGEAKGSGWFTANCVVNPQTRTCDDDGGGSSNEAPEPASLVILGTGLLGLAAMRRRRER
jgi:hypothetical protein